MPFPRIDVLLIIDFTRLADIETDDVFGLDMVNIKGLNTLISLVF